MVKKYNEELGKGYGKADIERVGLFAEMPYMHGVRYISPFSGNIKGKFVLD